MTESKSYMKVEKNIKVDEIQNKINEEEKKFGSMSRFGYFSIPYSSFIGDGYYSQGRKKSYRNEDGRVITEKRGIYTKPNKKGKTPDAFFPSVSPMDDEAINEKLKTMADKERQEYLELVKSRKKEEFKKKFKPAGPHEYQNYFDINENKVVYEVPITKEIDKKTKIDKDQRSVFTEKRGIFTNPSKKGNSTTPGILFAYPKTDENLLEMAKKEREKSKERSRSAGKTSSHQFPFKPASLMKNECFSPDHKVYGEDEIKFRTLLEDATEKKHKGQSKHQRILPPGAKKHDKPFFPPKLVKTGRDTLFKEVYGVPFIPYDKKVISVRERKEMEEKSKGRKNFTYNRLANASTFSPPITSFLPNLKKEFPRAFLK